MHKQNQRKNAIVINPRIKFNYIVKLIPSGFNTIPMDEKEWKSCNLNAHNQNNSTCFQKIS
jgi:hypothetical protein